MADGTAPNLREGHRRALGLGPAHTSQPKLYKSVEKLFKDDRGELLKAIPPWVIKKAWFALAHLFLEPGSRVIDMGSRDGSMVYTMSVLAPNMHFIGVDKNADTIQKSKENYQRPNLEFRHGDVLGDVLPENSVDAIICSFVLHEIFSNSGFNQRLVRQTLRQCQKYLKPGGLLLVRDYAEPDMPDAMVYLEMPDTPSLGDGPETMSEPDLLAWYSEYATMRDDPSGSGFFLEEVPSRFPRTRLFRLPHKWAYEFIMRKDQRSQLRDELPKEYTFFSEREYHKTINTLGLRVLYSAPHWDDTHIEKHFEKHFRLLDESGNPLGNPATSFIILSQKIDPRDSLLLAERRKTKNQETSFNVTTYRNDVDGRLVEVVSRDINTTDIIPFSIMTGNRLVVYLHEGVPRGLVNAVPRGARNLDGKFWSGHLTEAISVETDVISQLEEQGSKAVTGFVEESLGLKASVGHAFVAGPSYYPNPRFIAERVETRFISVEPAMGRFVPHFVRDELKGFASTGAVKAYDAQSILNAISVGALPSGNLEMQLLMLFSMLDIKATDWSETPLVLKEEEPPEHTIDVSDILKKTATKDRRYKEMRGTLGTIKLEKSVFVDEGVDSEGGNRGLAARDVDFAVNEGTGNNIAVILPLSRQHSGEVMAGVIVDFMPVPQRYAGNGQMITLPSLPLPKEILNMDMARRYIAEKYEIKPEQVSKLGEPYFSHIEVTPQRIFPFAINCPHSKMARPSHGMQGYTPMKDLGRLHWKELFERYDIDMLKVCGRANKRLFAESEMGFNWGFDLPLVEKYAQAPFTSGQSIDVRSNPSTPAATTTNAPKLSGGATPAKADTPAPDGKTVNNLPERIMPPSETGGLYSTGFAAASRDTSRGDKGKGGKSSAGSTGKRNMKPKPSSPMLAHDQSKIFRPEPGK
jgi:SAM-dependent methyltransferase